MLRGQLVSGNNSVVECDLAKVEVAGSNPVSRSTLPPEQQRSFPSGRRSQVVRQRSAKPLCGGSNPPGASPTGPATRLGPAGHHPGTARRLLRPSASARSPGPRPRSTRSTRRFSASKRFPNTLPAPPKPVLMPRQVRSTPAALYRSARRRAGDLGRLHRGEARYAGRRLHPRHRGLLPGDAHLRRMVQAARAGRHQRGRPQVSLESIVAGSLAALVLAYLIYTLVRPERF